MEYSVIIPAYNAENTIAEAVASVLAQTRPPAEILVVDDGSSDGTAALARGFGRRVRVISKANSGPGSATTAGLNATTCEIVATLDSDDKWLLEKMAVQLDYLASNETCDGVLTHIRTFRDDGMSERANEVHPGWSRTTLAIRRPAALQIGPVVDPQGGRGEMVDWFARARELGLRFDMLDQVLALRRIRPGSLSYGRDDEKDKGYLQVAWLALRRKKAQP
jgi:glycosyltransferase involved in cell wall biosynthesis